MQKKEVGHAIVTTIQVAADSKKQFIEWQRKIHAAISAFPGFVSIEIRSAGPEEQAVWTLVQRFSSKEAAAQWNKSTERVQLRDELVNLVGLPAIQEIEQSVSELQGGVTEVFVTQVSPDKEEAFRAWIAKIHQVETKFPGFRGVFLQSPIAEQGHNWLTFLHFDTEANLDHWLASPERMAMLKESKSFISSLESHRVISPYAGWFSSIEKKGQVPRAWKQSMIVLLVLYPIVMLESKFLHFLTGDLNQVLSTFIGNVISVSLLAWPMVPLAIYFLRWWLIPSGNTKINFIGFITVILLYLCEIGFFWFFN